MTKSQNENPILTLKFPHLKTITVILGIGRGGCYDLIPGSTRITLGIMTRASIHYPEDVVIQQTDGHGSILSYVLGSDHAGLRLKTLPEYLDPEFLLDLIQRPLLNDFMINRERDFAFQELLQVKSDPFSRHILLARKNIHAGEHLGISVLGTEDSLSKITNDQITTFHESDFFSGNKMAVICGNEINSKHVENLREGLKNLPNSSQAIKPKAPERESPILLQEEDLAQVYMSAALKGPAERSDDYLAFLLGSHVLGGGGLGNRLGTEIREKRGLAYYAGVLYLKDKEVVDLIAMTFTTARNANECLKIILSEIKRLATEPIPKEELEIHKAELIGQLIGLMDSSSQLATHYFTKAIRGADPDLERQINQIKTITPEQVKTTYENLLSRNTLYLTINGKIPKELSIPDLQLSL